MVLAVSYELRAMSNLGEEYSMLTLSVFTRQRRCSLEAHGS
jgi:hypothetical protein